MSSWARGPGHSGLLPDHSEWCVHLSLFTRPCTASGTWFVAASNFCLVERVRTNLKLNK